MTDSDVVVAALIGRIVESNGLDAASVGQLFGVTLEANDDPGNPYIRIFIGQPAAPSPVRKLELRVPAGNGPRSKALLILSLRPEAALPMASMRQRFGAPTRLEAPRAASPHGTPTYEVYVMPWGRLSFGYLPAEHDALREIVFDRS